VKKHAVSNILAHNNRIRICASYHITLDISSKRLGKESVMKDKVYARIESIFIAYAYQYY